MTISKNTAVPLVVVVGATGAQGGSVVKALEESDKPYRILGFTRDTTKPEAKELVERGVEMAAYDPHSTTFEETCKLFGGATYVFAVTVAAVIYPKEMEIAEGKRYVDAAKAVDVRLLIWSGLLSTYERSNGKYTRGEYFDAKAEVTQYARDVGVPFADVQAGAYMENYLGWFAPKKQSDGSYDIIGVMPATASMPLIDTHSDYGLFVRKAIEVTGVNEPEIYAHGEMITYEEIVNQWSKITGRRISYKQLSADEYVDGLKSSGFPEDPARKFLDTFLTFKEFGYWGDKDTAKSLVGLARKPRTWSEFVRKTDWSSILH